MNVLGVLGEILLFNNHEIINERKKPISCTRNLPFFCIKSFPVHPAIQSPNAYREGKVQSEGAIV